MDHPSPAPGRPHPDLDRPRSDKVLLFLLLVLNLGSGWTTVLGARQVLPSPLAEILGLTVQIMLFLLLAGATARHAPVRKWLVVGVFAGLSVYTSFFTYYETLAGQAVTADGLDRAHQAHAAFVSAAWQPTVTQAGRLQEEAAALDALTRDEAKAGVTTGAVGYGPQAREYAAQAREKRTQAAVLQRDLDRLAPLFERDLAGQTAEQVYQGDLAAWQAAPDAWKAAAPTPTRAAYVDLEQQVGLLTPFYKVQRGELPAVVALLIAALVDGMAILLGTAITGRSAPVVETVTARAASLVESAKDGAAQVRAAWDRPGVPRPLLQEAAPRSRAKAELEDPMQVVLLRIQGRGSDFLSALYEAIHPETGEVALAALLAHENPSFRIAARMLADRLRHPRLGWLVVRDGWWCVPPARYSALTGWLGEEIRKAVQAEEAARAVESEGPGERVLELVLPAAA